MCPINLHPIRLTALHLWGNGFEVSLQYAMYHRQSIIAEWSYRRIDDISVQRDRRRRTSIERYDG